MNKLPERDTKLAKWNIVANIVVKFYLKVLLLAFYQSPFKEREGSIEDHKIGKI